MTISMPKHGQNYKGFVLLQPDQARYVERRAEVDRSNNSAIIRRAVDVLMKLEPIQSDEPAEPAQVAS